MKCRNDWMGVCGLSVSVLQVAATVCSVRVVLEDRRVVGRLAISFSSRQVATSHIRAYEITGLCTL